MRTLNRGLLELAAEASISAMLPSKALLIELSPKVNLLLPLPRPFLKLPCMSSTTALASSLTSFTSVRSMTWKGMDTSLSIWSFWYTQARSLAAVSGLSQPESVMVSLVRTVVLVTMGMEEKGKVLSFTVWPSGTKPFSPVMETVAFPFAVSTPQSIK